jgi:hypothetical protein
VRVTGPLFKWFGSKWTSARTLPPPTYNEIVEPYAGSAGYCLRHSEKIVLLCERDPHLFLLWDWLIHDATEASIRDIPINVPAFTDIRTLGLSVGQATLLKTWQRTNNVGDCWTISPWGNRPGQWTENTRARVASEFGAVKHWGIRRDGVTFLRDTNVGCTYLVDPPYQYNYQYRGSPTDYDELSRLIRAKRGQKIVCEAVCPKTGAVPSWLPFVSHGSFVTSRRKAAENHHSKELIWIGYA